MSIPDDNQIRQPHDNSPAQPTQPGNFSSTQKIAMYYASKFPHPEHMERYANLYPGAPEIIFTAFQKQSAHRQELEKLAIPEQLKNARAGIYIQGLGAIVYA